MDSDPQSANTRRQEAEQERLAAEAKAKAEAKVKAEAEAKALHLQELFKRCKSARTGDDPVWREMIMDRSPEVTRLISRIGTKAKFHDIVHDIEEIRHEVFIQVCKSLSKYDEKRNPVKWVNGLTRNVTYTWLRRKRWNFLSLVDEDGKVVEFEDQKTRRPDQAAEANEKKRALEKALEALGEPESLCRRLLHLTYGEDLTTREIADIGREEETGGHTGPNALPTNHVEVWRMLNYCRKKLLVLFRQFYDPPH